MSEYYIFKDRIKEVKTRSQKFKQFLKRNKKIIFVALILIILPIFVIASQQRQETRQYASPADEPVLELSNSLIKEAKEKATGKRLKKSAQVASGEVIDKAKKRKALMLKLAKENPKEFLFNALPSKISENLPPLIKDQVEKEVQIKGKFIAIHFDDFKNKKSKSEFKIQELDKDNKVKKTYSLNFAAPIPYIESGTIVSISGFSLDGELVIQGGGSGGGLESFETPRLSPIGSQKILVLMFNFTDDPREPVSKSQINDLLFSDLPTSVKSFYKINSYEKTVLEGDVVGYYKIPYSNKDCTYYEWGPAARAIAFDNGINLDSYTRYLYVFPSRGNCWAPAWATIGGNPSEAWMVDVISPGIYAHELGHNFGSAHANTLDCKEKAIDFGEFGYWEKCSVREYGDPTDVMGFSAWGNSFQFNAPHKEEVQYLDQSQIVAIDGERTITISALENKDSNIKAARIPISQIGEYYYLSYRKAIDFDQNLKNGITQGIGIHLWRRINQYYDFSAQTKLIDNSPEGYEYNDFNNSSLIDGQVFEDLLNGISVKQLGHNSDSAEVEIKIDKSVCRHFDPDFNINPLSQVGSPGQELIYIAEIKNNDSSNCSPTDFNIYGYVNQSGWSVNNASINILPGEAKNIDVKVKPPFDARIGIYSLSTNLSSIYPRHSKEFQSRYIVFGELATINVNPEIIKTTLGSEPVSITVSVYDNFNNPIVGGVTYEWDISGVNSTGTLDRTDGSVNQFRPLKVGSGEIRVKVTFNGNSITKSIPVEVSDIPVSTLNLAPSADSFVRRDRPRNNFGTLNNFQTDSSPQTISFMKYNLRTLSDKEIIEAKLYIKVADASQANQSLRRVSENSWTERSINYNNRPSLGGTITSFKAGSKNKTIEIDVTGFVKSKKGEAISFGITSSGTNTAKYYSDEASRNNT